MRANVLCVDSGARFAKARVPSPIALIPCDGREESWAGDGAREDVASEEDDVENVPLKLFFHHHDIMLAVLPSTFRNRALDVLQREWEENGATEAQQRHAHEAPPVKVAQQRLGGVRIEADGECARKVE